jgi:tRNA A37 methylthiotransferase MiaB
VEELEGFLDQARMDAIGVFGYSDEEGTEAATYDQKLPQDVIEERVRRLSARVDELTAQRAEDRIGTQIEVLVHAVGSEDFGGDEGQDIDQGTAEENDQGAAWGTAAHQAPDVDGQTLLAAREVGGRYAPGDLALATVVDSLGIDLTAQPACERVPV